MALVTNITTTIKILNEDETAVIRKLSHVQLKMAAKARQSEGVGFMRELGAELMKALREEDTSTVKRLQDAQEADIHNYDRDLLLRFGISSWSYPVPPVWPKTTPGIEDMTDGVELLDEAAAKFLAEKIFEFSRPETKAEAKND